MSDQMKAALIALGGTIFGVSVAGGIGWNQNRIAEEQLAVAKQQAQQARQERDLAKSESEKLRRQFEEAPKKFVQRFGVLIEKAALETARKEGESNMVPFAQAIVSQRNSFRDEMRGLDRLLNSDIDRLEQELAKPSPDMVKVREILLTLKAKWALKEDEIRLAIKKLTALLLFLYEAEKLEPGK